MKHKTVGEWERMEYYQLNKEERNRRKNKGDTI